MSCIRLTAAVAAVVGASLTGCVATAVDSLSSGSQSEQSQASSGSQSEQSQALNFESDPPGAEIRTARGQTCITPCALTVPTQEQPVTITRDGYMTYFVNVGLQPDHTPPTLVPNPVRIVLDPVSKSVQHAKGHGAVSASAPPAPSAVSDPSPPPPPSPEGPAARFLRAFPPPPSKQ
jgi:hypothetical protein